MITIFKKQLLLYSLLAMAANVAVCQTTYVWNQTAAADWNTAANWTPQRITPAANDILVFNNGAVTTPNNIPTQIIGQLFVSNNTVVNLQGAAAGTIITISGLPGTDLQVTSGAELNITAAANTTTIMLATAATGSITGNINFLGAPHRLDAEDAGAVLFNSPAVFTQGAGCTGNVFNATGAANVVVFSAGTTLVQYAGGNPFGLAAPNSKVIFQTGSVLKIKQNVLIATQGRTYANVEVDFASFNQTLTGAALPVTIDDLTITQGILHLNFTGASGTVIRGNISVAAGQALHFNPAAAGMVHFNGTLPQTITNNGILTFGASQAVTINNNAGVRFNSPVTFNNTVNFIAGIVTVPGPLKITFGAAALAAGASDASFVDGRVEKMGNTAFAFPIGKPGFGLVPVTLNNFTGASAGTAFTAEYKRQSANSLSVNMAPGIHHVSGLDHWTIENTGTDVPAADVTLSWNSFTSNNGSVNFITLPGFLDLIAARFNPATAAWDSYGGQGNTIPGATVIAGGVTWPNITMLPVGVTAGFSLASTTVQNPLPVSIIYLTATKRSAAVLLEWKLGCGTNTHVQAELQRAGTTGIYSCIKSINTTAVRCLQPFNFTDEFPPAGVSYYRIKVTDTPGKISYSSIAAVVNSCSGFEITSVQPVIVTNGLHITIAAAEKTTLAVVITGMAGNMAVKKLYGLAAGSNFFDIDVAKLPAGVYNLTATTKNGSVKTVRFVKL